MPPIKGSSRQANRACSGWLNWAIHSTTSTGSCHSAILGSPAYASVRQKPLSWQESLCARSQPGREIANVGFFRKCSLTAADEIPRFRGRLAVDRPLVATHAHARQVFPSRAVADAVQVVNHQIGALFLSAVAALRGRIFLDDLRGQFAVQRLL